MNPRILITLLLFCACHSPQPQKQTADSTATTVAKSIDSIPSVVPPTQPPVIVPSDTTSTDYLVYLLKNEKPPSDYWLNKLNKIDIYELSVDSITRLTIDSSWILNDSISVIKLTRAWVNSDDEYLFTVKNKKDFIALIHIGDNADSDGYPYYYTVYKIINNKRVKLFNHKVTGDDGENDAIESVENWYIKDDGKVFKK